LKAGENDLEDDDDGINNVENEEVENNTGYVYIYL
jgi:hypothetical protein